MATKKPTKAPTRVMKPRRAATPAKQSAKPKPKPKAKTKPKPKPKRAKRAEVPELDVGQLLARGQQLDAERLARAAEQASVPQAVRAPVASRPAAAFNFAYPWWFDEAIPKPRRDELVALFSRFTKISNERAAFFVAAPNTDPERRRAAWDAGGTIVELDQLDGQLPEADIAARLARLERALADKTAWNDVVMLLSSWDPPTLDSAITAAERGLAAWSDELRTLPEAWTDRPELRPFARVAWGPIAETLQRPDLDNVRMVKTDDIAGLRANADRFAHLTALELFGGDGFDTQLLDLGALAQLEHLALQHPTYSSGTGTIALRKLLAAPHLQRLHALSLYGYTLTDDDLDALATCSQPLRFVRLQYASMKPAQAKRLAWLAASKRIERLDLKYNDLGPKGAATLFANGGDFAALEVLDLSANEIGPKGVTALCGADLRSLRWLNLSSNAQKEQLDAGAAKTIASTSSLANLEQLNVFGHSIGAAGVVALVESTALRSLRELNAAFPGCSYAEIFAAATGKGATKLAELGLGNAKSSKRGGDWSRGRFLSTVRMLSVESCGAGDYAPLLACPHFDALEILALGSCYSDADKAFAALVHATPPPKLRYLDLKGWKLTPEQATQLASSPLGQQLWGVELMTSYTTPETWRVFYDAGLPLASSAILWCDPASEHRSFTTFRAEL